MSLQVNDRVTVSNDTDLNGKEGVAQRVKATYAYVLLDGETAARFFSRDDLTRIVNSEVDARDLTEAQETMKEIDAITAHALSTYDKQMIESGLSLAKQFDTENDPYQLVFKALTLAAKALGL